ncbi:heme-binding protein 2-like [Mercenaria mercenaria]|uniref:heme-binding protein 2-like n=1 Tax=Mercenaria mercenaria TaxID=6596 RepID=UPI00234E8546|nr:heme-binding protein 2-like [Mercenaria mercenaria]
MVNLRSIDMSAESLFPTSAESLLPDTVMGTLKNFMPKSPEKPKHMIEYKVVTKTDDYEERRYPASTWVCTTVTGVYQDTAKIEAFRHLQTYAQGHNSASAHLSMHPPILTRVSSDSGAGFDRKFVVSTYLCEDHTGEHPQPSSKHVYLEHLPEMTVFVRNFQGIACEEKWTYETKRLAEVLRNKEDIRTDFYITATYESPFQLVSSRNEIWFLKFDRKEDTTQINRETKMLKYGSQKVEIPSVLGWILQMIMAYLTVLFFIARTSLNFMFTAKENWSVIQQRAHLAFKVVRHNVSFGGLLRTAISVMWMLWNIVLALISGATIGAYTSKPFKKKSF